MFPLEFRAEVNHEETRDYGLSCSEDPMIAAWVIDAVPACDGFTIASTALCIASWEPVKTVRVKTVLGKNGPGKKGPSDYLDSR